MSERKVRANRRNGALSRGPSSPEGKAIVRLNGVKHGLRAQHLLPHESKVEWERHLAETRQGFAPRDAFEDSIVQQIAAAMWRLRRGFDFEAALARHAEQRNISQAERQRLNSALSPSSPPPPSLADLRALAAVPDEAGFEKLMRYETYASRSIDRLMQRLAAYRELNRSRGAPVFVVEVQDCQPNPRRVESRQIFSLPAAALERSVKPERLRLKGHK